MRKSLQSVTFERLEKALLSLGYYRDKQNQYRRGRFHVILKPYKKRVELRIHANSRRFSLPLVGHKARYTGKDISEELKRIEKALYMC